MAKSKTVGVSAVREFHNMPLNQRGRVSATLIEAYEKATGNKVVTGLKTEPAKVTLKVRRKNKAGKFQTVRVQKTLAEVRALAGEPENKRGKVSGAVLAKATAALSDPEASESE